MKKLSRDVSVKLPKSKAAQEKLAKAAAERHAHYTYPTLSVRQAAILLECMKLGLEFGVTVDGMHVTGDEWIELTKTLIRTA